MISGFLLGKQLKSSKQSFSYYKRRLSVVGIPFLVAFLIFYIKSIGTFGVMIGRFDKSILAFPRLVDQLWSGLFFTSYWFIFVFLLSLALMLVGWRYLSLKTVTILSFAATLFYAVNIYTTWIEPRHTFAFPAFVFYLCAGVWLARYDEVIERIQNTSNLWLTSFLLMTFLLAAGESIFLWKLDSIDPRNSLRISNQLFSIAMFIWLFRNNYLHKLPFLNPRTESFGIYLYHLFFVGFIAKFIVYIPIFSFLSYQPDYTTLELALASILRFLLAYITTLLFVKLVNLTRLRWIFGNTSA
ncbi:acyltransferase family protein [Spirosoma aerophilum]